MVVVSERLVFPQSFEPKGLSQSLVPDRDACSSCKDDVYVWMDSVSIATVK